MRFRVLLADDAERDIEDIYRHIANHDSVANADHVLAALEDACARLSEMPDRGNIPKELNAPTTSSMQDTTKSKLIML